MKCISLVVSFFLAIVLTPSIMFATDLKEDKLESITFNTTPGQGESIRFQLTEKVIPEISTIGGKKPRLILDFFDIQASAGVKNIVEMSGKLVRSIRVGRHFEPRAKVRVVIDLTPDVSYQYEEKMLELENVFELSLLQEGKSIVKSPFEQTAPAPTEIASGEGNKKDPTDLPPSVNTETTSAVREVAPVVESLPSATIEQQGIDSPFIEKSAKVVGNDSSEAEDPKDAKLLDVSFENSSNKGEMVLFKLNGFYPPIVFGVEKGEPRVVCDFLDTNVAKKIVGQIQCDGKFITSIQIDSSSNPQKVRVILNLMANKNYDLQQVFFKEDNLFVLIVDTLEDI